MFYHFVGAVPLSTSLSDMLQRLLMDLCGVSLVKTSNLFFYQIFNFFAFVFTHSINFAFIV